MIPGGYEWLVLLLVVVLVFGTKKLRNVGGDLGSAVKSFKKAMQDEDEAGKKNAPPEQLADDSKSRVFDAKAESQAKDDSKHQV